MKLRLRGVCLLLITLSCSTNKSAEREASINMEGTWQLVSGTIIEKGDTSFTNYTKERQMIKVINKTHFVFLNHDLTKGKDSSALFIAGGGRYELRGDQYTEHLEYCSDRAWEGYDFRFTIKVQNDTLTQTGMEKIDSIKVNRMNIEKYFRVKG